MGSTGAVCSQMFSSIARTLARLVPGDAQSQETGTAAHSPPRAGEAVPIQHPGARQVLWRAHVQHARPGRRAGRCASRASQ